MLQRLFELFRMLTISMSLSLFLVAKSEAANANEVPYHLSIYAGSRGDGVPEEAIRRLGLIERYLTEWQARAHNTIWLKRNVVGLEGEIMLCVELARTEENAYVLERVKSMVSPVAMLSVSVTSSCRAR